MATKKKNTKSKAIPTITHRKPFLCIDCRWKAFGKWLWDEWAGPNETYSGYITYWDDVPWQTVMHDDGVERDHNFAAQAQYIPTYAGDIIGFVDDLGKLLHKDGILEDEIIAQYSHEMPVGLVSLKRILYRDFDDSLPRQCPVVYSRPATYRYRGAGHICDNAHQSNFCTAAMSCDGTAGLKDELGVNYIREFFADAIHFVRKIRVSDMPDVPHDARLVVYIIATGSVGRICINGGDWHIVSSGYFPSYGDPYNFNYHGYKAVIEDHGLIFGTGDDVAATHASPLPDEGAETEPSPIPMNEIIVELIAPRPEDLGAQVIFSFEWTEIITETTPQIKPTRRKKMSKPTVTDRIKQAYAMKIADDKAIANGDPWQLLSGVRAELDAIHTLMIGTESTVQTSIDDYHTIVDEKDKAEDNAGEAYEDLRGYIITKYPKDKSKKLLEKLNIDVPIEEDDDEAVARLFVVMNRWAQYDGTPDEIPADYKNAITSATTAFATLVMQVMALKTAMQSAYKERNKVFDNFVQLCKRIRRWLFRKMPDKRYDRRLLDYGFDPYEKASYPIPDKVENLQGVWDKIENRAELKWLSAAEATNYEIWRGVQPLDPNENPVLEYYAATKNIYYFDQNATAGSTYHYKVRGKNRWHDGEFSDKVEVKCI